MITFLQLNGYVTNFSQDEAIHFILTITTSKKEFNDLKEEVASYLQDSHRASPNF